MSTPLLLRTPSSGPRADDASPSSASTTATASSPRVPTFGNIPNSSASSSPTCPLLDSSSSPLHSFCLHTSCGPTSPPAAAAMSMASPPPALPRDLWRPGSTSFPSSSREAIDPLESKRQLQKLYEDLSESSYDLSLKDIVDPSYSISGNLKAMANNDDLQHGGDKMLSSSPSTSSSKEHKTKVRLRRKASDHQHRRDKYLVSGTPKCRLAFSFSVPGMHAFRGGSRAGRPLCPRLGTLRQSPDEHEQTEKASFKRSMISHSSPSKPKYSRDLKQRSFSASRVHPSNQCSSCSSYTIFFKTRCLVCGKLYCSNCAKDAMDVMSDGRKCKNDSCNVRPASRRFSKSVGKSCWPFCGNIEVQELQSKQTHNGA